jgi:hypothetical protein
LSARTHLDYGCLLFILPQENLKQKPHTHVFPSNMVVIVYNCVVCVQDVWMDPIVAHAIETGDWPVGFKPRGTMYAASE